MVNPAFAESLRRGQKTESAISCWMRHSRGAAVLPVYETEIDSGKGPRLLLPEGELIAPDMLVISGKGVCWIEAKHKTHFAWSKITKTWQTGIDRRHYEDYLRLDARLQWPVWLLFFHAHDTPYRRRGCDPDQPIHCRTGLYGNSLTYLEDHRDHFGGYPDDCGRFVPMVYWNERDLRLLATVDDVHATRL